MNKKNHVNKFDENLKRLATDECPESDLWQKINRELHKKQKHTMGNILHSFYTRRPLLAAFACASMTVIAIGTIYFSQTLPNSRNNFSTEFAVLEEFADAEKEYNKVKQSLLDSLQKSGMPVSETQRIESSLKQIDGAIYEIKTTIIKYPDNKSNRMYLADLYKQETLFLSKIENNVKRIND